MFQLLLCKNVLSQALGEKEYPVPSLQVVRPFAAGPQGRVLAA